MTKGRQAALAPVYANARAVITKLIMEYDA